MTAFTFSNIADILKEAFWTDGEGSSNTEGIDSIVPSVSSEYLRPKAEVETTESESEYTTDYRAIADHPLLHVLRSILKKKASQHGGNGQEAVRRKASVLRLDSIKEKFTLSPGKISPEIDKFMKHAVLIARQLSEHKTDAFQSIDNKCDFFAGEMSMFCENLLKQDESSASEQKSTAGQTKNNSSSNLTDGDDNTGKQTKSCLKARTRETKKCSRLTKRNQQLLREWLLEHADHPFPSDDEKDMLCLRTGLTLAKLNTWFSNSRRRILKPLGLRN